MNLLARILSHGFAFVVVALIIFVLVYRGDLFEESDLPDFLALEDKSLATDESGPGAVDRAAATIDSGADVASSAPVTETAETAEPEPATPDVAEEDEAPAADAAPADIGDTEAEAAPTTPAGAGAAPAVEEAAVVEPEPAPEAETEPVDTAAEAPASADTEGTTAQAADDDSAVAPPATGEDEGARPSAEAGTEDPQEVVERMAPEAAAITELSTATDAPAEQAVEEPAAATVTTASDASTPAVTPDTAIAADIPAAPADAVPAAPPVAAPTADTAAAPAEVEPAAPADAVPAAPPVAVPTADDTGESDTPYNVLAKAREAYWLRDFTTAEQQYKKLIRLEPANPDGYGELGNMYFSRGMWDEAANAYYEAGVRLLDEELIVQARQMVEVIRGLNGSQADELNAKINSVVSSSP